MDAHAATAELRLRKLAVDLKKAYSRVAKNVADTLAPLEVAVSEIGETWKPAHYAESVRSRGPEGAVRPVTCFAHEVFVNGDEADYVLCVGRRPDLKCGLYVSVCKYRVGADAGENGSSDKPGEVTIKATLLAPVNALPVPLRMKVLDVLDDFAAAYDEHVREIRRELLSTWGGPGPAPEPTPTEDAPEQESEKGRVRLFSPDDSSVPPERWIPAMAGAK